MMLFNPRLLLLAALGCVLFSGAHVGWCDDRALMKSDRTKLSGSHQKQVKAVELAQSAAAGWLFRHRLHVPLNASDPLPSAPEKRVWYNYPEKVMTYDSSGSYKYYSSVRKFLNPTERDEVEKKRGKTLEEGIGTYNAGSAWAHFPPEHGEAGVLDVAIATVSHNRISGKLSKNLTILDVFPAPSGVAPAHHVGLKNKASGRVAGPQSTVLSGSKNQPFGAIGVAYAFTDGKTSPTITLHNFREVESLVASRLRTYSRFDERRQAKSHRRESALGGREDFVSEAADVGIDVAIDSLDTHPKGAVVILDDTAEEYSMQQFGMPEEWQVGVARDAAMEAFEMSVSEYYPYGTQNPPNPPGGGRKLKLGNDGAVGAWSSQGWNPADDAAEAARVAYDSFE